MDSKKLILLDVFSYSCMNCLRSLKYIEKINAKYNKYGLTTILIHPPEWKFEKNKDNIVAALRKHNIKFPLIIDRNKKIIKRLNINFWPTQLLIRNEKILYKHVGEGNYKKLETAIQNILKIKTKKVFGKEPRYTKFPAVYLRKIKDRNIVDNKNKLKFGSVYAEGRWIQKEEYLKNKGKGSSLTTITKGNVIRIVAKSNKIAKIIVKLDNKFFRRLTIGKPDLYAVANIKDNKQHKLTLATKSDIAIYSFTFE